MEEPKSKSMTTNNGKTVGASIAGEREAQADILRGDSPLR